MTCRICAFSLLLNISDLSVFVSPTFATATYDLIVRCQEKAELRKMQVVVSAVRCQANGVSWGYQPGTRYWKAHRDI